MTPTPVSRRSRENTRARLVEAAVEVFAEKALRRVTVDDLVGSAGFTRGAFYSNFASIDELFFEVYAEQADLMLAAVRTAIDEIPPAEFSLAIAALRARRVASLRPPVVPHPERVRAARRTRRRGS